MDLELVGSVGGFFALRTGNPPAGAVPLAQVYAGDDAPLALRVAKVAAALRAPEPRIGVSVAQLGLAARLWSVALGPVVLYGTVLDLDPAWLHWDPDGSVPDDLWLAVSTRESLPLPGAHGGDAAGLAAAVMDAVVDGHLEPLAASLRRTHRISAGLLWGNAGSALAGAVRALHIWARRDGRPEAAERALMLGELLLRHPRLRETGTLSVGEAGSLAAAGPAVAFRRRSCCLIYRCPGGGLCGDCCFSRPPGGTNVA